MEGNRAHEHHMQQHVKNNKLYYIINQLQDLQQVDAAFVRCMNSGWLEMCDKDVQGQENNKETCELQENANRKHKRKTHRQDTVKCGAR